MKTKAKTLIEKQGFLDPDRASQSHDQIHLFAYDKLVEILESVSRGKKTFNILAKEMEYPILLTSGSYRGIVGFLDLYAEVYVTDRTEACGRKFHVCLEIKSRISSCGDLIRQINFYKKFLVRSYIWIVVSPDDRFSKVLLEHGIYFYKFDGETTTA